MLRSILERQHPAVPASITTLTFPRAHGHFLQSARLLCGPRFIVQSHEGHLAQAKQEPAHPCTACRSLLSETPLLVGVVAHEARASAAISSRLLRLRFPQHAVHRVNGDMRLLGANLTDQR